MARTWTEAQNAAISLKGSALLVSAAAGSGKTSVLTERIIRSLTDPEHPAELSRMLVVTFTRAAAAELKSRIAAALSEALAEDPENPHLTAQLFRLGSAQISTIDSFFQKTVREHFEQLDIPASFRIAEDGELGVLSTEILSSVITHFYTVYANSERSTDPEAPFQSIASNRFASALNHLMSNRSDGKLIPLLLDFYEQFSKDPLGIDRLKELAVQLRGECGLPFLQSTYGNGWKESYRSLFSEDLEILQDFAIRLSADPAAEVICSGLLSSDRDFITALLRALDSDSILSVRQVAESFIRGSFPRIKEKSDEILRFQAWRDLFKKHVESLQKDLADVNDALSDQILQTAELCEMLHLLFQTYQTRFLEEKKVRGVLEYQDIRSMLYRLLIAEDGSLTATAKALSAKYDAVYIDEYQDVDTVQDHIFAAIGGNRRFMVGDIKQSIYGFRGSEPSIFAGYRRAFPLHTEPTEAPVAGRCVFMSENFRCNRPIIDFTNQVCSFLFSASDKSIGYRREDDLCCSKPQPDHPQPVRIAVFPPTASAKAEKSDHTSSENIVNADPEAVWIAQEIERLLQCETLDNGAPITPSDIVILVRSKKHGDPILRELRKRKIPVRSDASDNPLHTPIVTDFVNLLRSVDNPYRDLPLSEFLLSPIGGFQLSELETLRSALPARHALFDALEFGASEAEPHLAQKVSACLRWIEKLQKLASVHSADRFLELLYREERIKPHIGHPAFQYLYDQARIYQRSSWCGLYGFLQHVDKLLEKDEIKVPSTSSERAVTVMTVHRSKGLEFPVVFLSRCAASFNKDDLKKPLLYHKNIGFASLLYNENSALQEDNLLRTAVKHAVEQDLAEESIRTLYVALTRARERLYITATLRAKWETVKAQADAIRRGKRMSILRGQSYFTWILAAVAEQGHTAGQSHACLHLWTPEEIACLTANETVPNSDPPKQAPVPPSPPTERLTQTETEYVTILQQVPTDLAIRSPLQKIPSKLAASHLRPHLLEDLISETEDDRAVLTQLELMQKEVSFDTLLNDRKMPKATDIGTATHSFLEFCDFRNFAENGIDAECARLLEKNYISRQTADLLNRSQLQAFRESELLQWILSAKELRRELTFGLFFPAAEIADDPKLQELLREESIFVQGSIDLFLTRADGKTVLADYKTDRLSAEELADDDLLREKMQRTHGHQLACYAKAVRELFGKDPDEICIYSLPAGRSVSIPLSSDPLRSPVSDLS